MTRDEYRALTKIENEDDARNLLVRTNWLFTGVFIAMILSQVANAVMLPEQGVAIGIVYIALLIYLTVHSAQVIKRTQPVNKAWAGFAIIFAPISWIWFYPELVKPLKIIAGDMEPPTAVDLPKPMTEEEHIAMKKRIRRHTWRTMGVITLITMGILTVLTVIFALAEGS